MSEENTANKTVNEDATEPAAISEADRLRTLIEKAWDTDSEITLSTFLLLLEDDEDLLCAAKYVDVIKSALKFE